MMAGSILASSHPNRAQMAYGGVQPVVVQQQPVIVQQPAPIIMQQQTTVMQQPLYAAPPARAPQPFTLQASVPAGGTMAFQTPDGRSMQIVVPAGVQQGQMFQVMA